MYWSCKVTDTYIHKTALIVHSGISVCYISVRCDNKLPSFSITPFLSFGSLPG